MTNSRSSTSSQARGKAYIAYEYEDDGELVKQRVFFGDPDVFFGAPGVVQGWMNGLAHHAPADHHIMVYELVATFDGEFDENRSPIWKRP
jgi:hypothetical protein